jgi:hypothetical protein
LLALTKPGRVGVTLSSSESFCSIPSLLVGAATSRLWCCNVEDAEEVTPDNVSLTTVSSVAEVQVGS